MYKRQAYNGVPNNGGLVTFKLPYAVGSLKMTGIEVHWPNAVRGTNRFLSFEVSADGENWTPFAMAGSSFTMVNNPNLSKDDNTPKVSLPIYRLGVTYYGTSDTQFQYVRIAFGRDWAPQDVYKRQVESLPPLYPQIQGILSCKYKSLMISMTSSISAFDKLTMFFT